MALEYKELKICKEVEAGQTVAETYTPSASVTEINVCCFVGEAAYSTNSVVKLVWKWNHASEAEVLLWSTKGSAHEDKINILITDCDGVRKLAVVLENGEDGNLVMTGACHWKEKS
jgi:hypothetical protein